MQEELDPFEMLEPVNILDRLAKDFFEKIVRRSDYRTISGMNLSLVGIETMERSKGSFWTIW